MRNISTAAQDYYEAVKQRPADAVAPYRVAACAYLMSDTTTARVWAELSLARDPSAAQTAALLQRLGEPPELVPAQRALKACQYAFALPLFERVTRVYPLSALGWMGDAACQARQGNSAQAMASLRQVEAREPRNPDLPALRRFLDSAAENKPGTADDTGMAGMELDAADVESAAPAR